ncbi:hypothetical protein ACOME3_002944 [Neoechinorhynchus agilis]
MVMRLGCGKKIVSVNDSVAHFCGKIVTRFLGKSVMSSSRKWWRNPQVPNSARLLDLFDQRRHDFTTITLEQRETPTKQADEEMKNLYDSEFRSADCIDLLINDLQRRNDPLIAAVLLLIRASKVKFKCELPVYSNHWLSRAYRAEREFTKYGEVNCKLIIRKHIRINGCLDLNYDMYQKISHCH